MAFRTAVLRSSGGFREDLGRVGRRPVGNEETELCIRVRQQEPQGVFVYEPAALVHHRVRDARATWRYFAERCWAEGISKSATVGYVGAEDGLASERTQLLQVLPRAVRRGPASETVAIGIGVACTGAGYVSGRARRRLARLSARREGGER